MKITIEIHGLGIGQENELFEVISMIVRMTAKALSFTVKRIQ